jgi:hypothetical protein
MHTKFSRKTRTEEPYEEPCVDERILKTDLNEIRYERVDWLWTGGNGGLL